MFRILAPGRHLALYISDSFVKGKGFIPIGFRIFGLLWARFEPIDIVAVARRNRTLEMGNYRRAAEEGNFFLRGFNYLFIMRKAGSKKTDSSAGRREKSGKKRERHEGNRG